MAETTVSGVDRDMLQPYTVVLNRGEGAEYIPVYAPSYLRAVWPAAGDLITQGPRGPEMEFDPRNPAAVFAWLVTYTDVVHIDGPGLLPEPAEDECQDLDHDVSVRGRLAESEGKESGRDGSAT